jgi:hypothetical protein
VGKLDGHHQDHEALQTRTQTFLTISATTSPATTTLNHRRCRPSIDEMFCKARLWILLFHAPRGDDSSAGGCSTVE